MFKKGALYKIKDDSYIHQDHVLLAFSQSSPDVSTITVLAGTLNGQVVEIIEDSKNSMLKVWVPALRIYKFVLTERLTLLKDV